MANIENPPQNIKPQQKTEKRSWIDGNYKFETIRDKGIYKKTSLITGKVSYVAHVTNPHTGKQIKGTRCLLDERNPSADSRGVA